MAEYYFCNGTTRANRPCQNHVDKEGHKCRFHNGGGGPTEMAKRAFSSGKSVLDMIVYIHSASDASEFLIELTNKTLGYFSKAFDLELQEAKQMLELYLEQEKVICHQISKASSDQLQAFYGRCNFLNSQFNLELVDKSSGGEMQRGA